MSSHSTSHKTPSDPPLPAAEVAVRHFDKFSPALIRTLATRFGPRAVECVWRQPFSDALARLH